LRFEHSAGEEMTKQSQFNDSSLKEELIFVFPWTCSLQVEKRVGDFAIAAKRGGRSMQQGIGRRKQ